jgi:hypothetical protein
MTPLKTGILTNTLDFNQTSLCLEKGLERGVKQSCRGIPGLWPNVAGALLLFQV